MPKNRGFTAKDFVAYWMKSYYKRTGLRYSASWMTDGMVFKRLMSQYSNARLKQLIHFSFSGDPATRWLETKGYPIKLLPSQVNSFLGMIKRPWTTIQVYDADLGVAYYDDHRTEYLWSCIKTGKINELIDNVVNKFFWHLMMYKMEYQDGHIPELVFTYYQLWVDNDKIKRTRIKKGHK